MGSILLISDLHADMGALDEILRLAFSEDLSGRYGSITKIINLGDVMERGHEPGEVISRLEGMDNVESILGNHDEAFISRTPVSGSDVESMLAHDGYRKTGQYERFFRGMGKYYVDTENMLYAVHGGPVDPCAIVPPASAGIEAWLYTQPWQRISDIDIRYVDGSGYRYLPQDAFDAVRPTFGRPGFVIICGHEHAEAAFREKGDVVDDVLPGLTKTAFEAGGRRVCEKKLVIEDDANYLVRLGLAGPEGYGGCVADRCYFGIYGESKGERAMYLLNFVPKGNLK